jgi:membrane-bound lytic murein transglycosylase MltF
MSSNDRYTTTARGFRSQVSGTEEPRPDWLLMAAQGYQESQLNQAAKSKVGAIGVM